MNRKRDFEMRSEVCELPPKENVRRTSQASIEVEYLRQPKILRQGIKMRF